MKRKVTITFEIDPKDYTSAKDTPKGVLDLVTDILENQTDFPPREDITIQCEGEKVVVELN